MLRDVPRDYEKKLYNEGNLKYKKIQGVNFH
jgi:hypothetical protein